MHMQVVTENPCFNKRLYSFHHRFISKINKSYSFSSSGFKNNKKHNKNIVFVSQVKRDCHLEMDWKHNVECIKSAIPLCLSGWACEAELLLLWIYRDETGAFDSIPIWPDWFECCLVLDCDDWAGIGICLPLQSRIWSAETVQDIEFAYTLPKVIFRK